MQSLNDFLKVISEQGLRSFLGAFNGFYLLESQAYFIGKLINF